MHMTRSQIHYATVGPLCAKMIKPRIDAVLLSIVVVVFGLAPLALAEVRIDPLFSSHMVLQRDAPIAIWGLATPGEGVTVAMAGQTATTNGDAAGRWRVTLPPLGAGGPFDLIARGGNSVALNGILIGDVWLCIGQVRMEASLGASPAAQQLLKQASNPFLRLAKVSPVKTGKPRGEPCRSLEWTGVAENTCAGFSGAGFVFADELQRRLNVPVGIIQVTFSNSRLPMWTPRESMLADPELRSIVTDSDEVTGDYMDAMRKYVRQLEAWEARDKSDPESEPPMPPIPTDPHYYGYWASSLFNGAVAPLGKMNVRGIVCLVGDLDSQFARQVDRLLPAMFAGWRGAWGKADLPIVLGLSPGAGNPEAGTGQSAWAELREAQLRSGSGAGSRTTVVVTTDLSDAPAIGRRLALAAGARVYGEQGAWSGPVVDSVKTEAGALRVSFKSVNGALAAADSGKVRGFLIAGEDKKFVAAEARIEGQSVIVSHPQVAAPVAVRYNWADSPEGNLTDKTSLPVPPFRSDNWPGLTDNNRYSIM